MGKKTSCENTDYTNGFTITTQPDGTFTATKGKIKLKAANAAEINNLIKNYKE